jgi:tetratricopeptide (TPR) repeat protein
MNQLCSRFGYLFTGRRAVLLLSAAAFLCEPANGQTDGDEPRRLDPKRIINQSMNFLREREPDMSAEESALYENARKQTPDLAIKLVESLVSGGKREKPASPAFHLLLGNLYYAAGSVEKAEANYLRAVERYPGFLRAWTNLGTLYYAQNLHAKAIPCFAKAVNLGARQATTFGMMGICLELTGDPVGAEVAYVEALAADPGNAAWMEGLLRVYLAAQQHARAEVMVRKLIHEQPSERRHWITYAHLLKSAGRDLETMALLEQIVATGIASDAELLELAGIYADHQMIPEAMEAYGRLKMPPAQLLNDQRILKWIQMLLARSELKTAQALLDTLRPKFAGEFHPEFLLAEADLLMAQGRWPAARATLLGLLNADPMNGRALLRLGRTYAAEGDWSRAELTFETATHTREGVQPASIELANLELKNRHYAKSASHLETALALEKNPDLEEILGRVKTLSSSAGGYGK